MDFTTIPSLREMLVAPVLCLLLCGPAVAATPEQVARGHTLSSQQCASCHQVSPSQRIPMRVYNAKTHDDQTTLSFMEIAARNGRDAHFLSDTLDEPHYPMRKRVLSDAEKSSIIAYIQSLAKPR